MDFNSVKLILISKKISSRINLFNFGLFIIAVSSLSIYFPFFLHEIFAAFISLFFSGYLFYRLIIKSCPLIETFLFSVVLSTGIIVFSTFILTSVFSFPFTKETIVSAAVLSAVFFLGLHFLRRFLNE